MPTITEDLIAESITVIDDRAVYTEAYLYGDGRIGLHAEDGENCAEPVYTVEQARALHEALGHLLYLANQEA